MAAPRGGVEDGQEVLVEIQDRVASILRGREGGAGGVHRLQQRVEVAAEQVQDRVPGQRPQGGAEQRTELTRQRPPGIAGDVHRCRLAREQQAEAQGLGEGTGEPVVRVGGVAGGAQRRAELRPHRRQRGRGAGAAAVQHDPPHPKCRAAQRSGEVRGAARDRRARSLDRRRSGAGRHAGAAGSVRAQHAKRLFEVGDQVLRRLQPDMQPQHLAREPAGAGGAA